MMINIRALSFLLFASVVNAHDIELRIPETSSKHLEYIKQLGEQYPGKTMKIEVIPETTFFEKIKNSLTSQTSIDSTRQGSSSSNISAGMYLIKSCFGATAVSYFSIAYIIYRSYKIAKKIKLWFKEDEQEESPLNDIERMLFKKQTCKLNKSDKNYLKLYLRLNKFLQKTGLRRFFIKNKDYDNLIYAYSNS